MGWVKKIDDPSTFPHFCMPFKMYGIGTGSVWKCDTCGQTWTLVSGGRGRRWTRGTYGV